MFQGLPAGRSRHTPRQGVAYVHVLLNCALQSLADVLLQPIILLASLFWILQGSTADIAVAAVAAAAPWALASIFMPLILHLADSVPAVTFVSGIVRAVSAACIAYLGWRVSEIGGDNLVALLVLSFLVYQVSAAVSVQASHEAIAGRANRWPHVRTFGDRRLGGAIAAAIGGFIAWRAFSVEQAHMTQAAGWLLMLAGLAAVSATWFQLTMPGPSQVRRTIVDLVDRRALGATLRSRAMRRYLAFRLVLGLSTLADPFIIVLGLSEMGLQPRYVGGSILVFALAQVGGGGVWPLLLDARGSRLPLQIAALLRLIAVTLAVIVPGVARSSAYQERYDSPAVASWAFVAAFALLGLARSAHDPSEHRYLEDITTSPTLQRAAIVATNVVLTLTAGAALIGAVLVGRYSLETTLIIAAAISFVALIASGLLFEGRPRVQYRSGARSGRIRRISRVRRRSSTRAQ